MNISVVIATYNRLTLLRRTLPSVVGQTLTRGDYEVIFVVDGSTDGSAEYLETIAAPRTCSSVAAHTHAAAPYINDARNITVVRQTNRGLAAARNVGIARASGEIILILDDDLECTPGLIEAHLDAHERLGTTPALVIGPVTSLPPRSAAERRTAAWLADHYAVVARAGQSHRSSDRSELPLEYGRVPPNASIRGDVLLAVGRFDESFRNAHEDIELGLRLRKSGVRLEFEPRAIAVQLATKTATEMSGREATLAGRAEVQLCRKHPEYRPHSALAKMRGAASVSDSWRWVLPWLARPLGFMAGVLRRICGAVGWRRAESKLLGHECSFNLLRAAVMEAGGARRFAAEYWRTLPVLLYHNVGPARPTRFPDLIVTPERFEAQMQWLRRRGYTPITPDDWVAWVLRARNLPRRPVLITFDDAYRELLTYALPTLTCLQFTAVVYVPTAEVGKSNAWDRASGAEELPLMTAGEISLWQQRGIVFGSHTRHHVNLRRAAPSDVEAEVIESGEELARITGHRPSSFAYPWGEYDANAVKVVARAYDTAVTTEEGLNDLTCELLRLKRTMVMPTDTLAGFASRVIFGSNLFLRLRGRVQLRTRVRRAVTALTSG